MNRVAAAAMRPRNHLALPYSARAAVTVQAKRVQPLPQNNLGHAAEKHPCGQGCAIAEHSANQRRAEHISRKELIEALSPRCGAGAPLKNDKRQQDEANADQGASGCDKHPGGQAIVGRLEPGQRTTYPKKKQGHRHQVHQSHVDPCTRVVSAFTVYELLDHRQAMDRFCCKCKAYAQPHGRLEQTRNLLPLRVPPLLIRIHTFEHVRFPR